MKGHHGQPAVSWSFNHNLHSGVALRQKIADRLGVATAIRLQIYYHLSHDKEPSVVVEVFTPRGNGEPTHRFEEPFEGYPSEALLGKLALVFG